MTTLARTEHREKLTEVRLADVPVALLLASQRHLDDLVHELNLIVTGERSGVTHLDLPVRVHAAITSIMQTYQGVRQLTTRVAEAAHHRGDATVDLVLELPADAADAAETLLRCLDELDRAQSMDTFLLQPPPAADVAAFRRTLTAQIAGQLRLTR